MNGLIKYHKSNISIYHFYTRSVNVTIPNVEVPKIDVQDLLQGDWKVGHFECLNDPPMCKY